MLAYLKKKKNIVLTDIQLKVWKARNYIENDVFLFLSTSASAWYLHERQFVLRYYHLPALCCNSNASLEPASELPQGFVCFVLFHVHHGIAASI